MSDRNGVQNAECGAKAFPEGVSPAEARAQGPACGVQANPGRTRNFHLSSDRSSPTCWGKQLNVHIELLSSQAQGPVILEPPCTGITRGAYMLVSVLPNRQWVPLALPEPSTRDRELQWRNIGCFVIVMNGATQDNGNLMLKAQTLQRHVGYRLHRAE